VRKDCVEYCWQEGPANVLNLDLTLNKL